MEHKKIHPAGPVFSRIITGAWRWDKLNTQQIQTLIQTSLDCGITTFDHADIYGDHTVEELFGKALSPGIRQKVQLISKCGIKFPSERRPGVYVKHYDTSKTHILWSVENSLKMLQTDRLDLLLIHRPDPLLNPIEVAEAFSALKASGKVLHFGVSNFTPSQFRLLQSVLDFSLVTNQIEISLLKTESLEDGQLDFLFERNVSPLAWSPLGGGDLASKNIKLKDFPGATTAQLSLAWLLKHPAQIFPILGTSKPERIIEAAQAIALNLTKQQWFDLYRQAKGIDVS
jgi:predicted oxidoreductase